MIERILKIVYVFVMFINVGLYGVSFILKLNMIPIQVDLSGLSAVEKREMLSNLAINYPLWHHTPGMYCAIEKWRLNSAPLASLPQANLM